MPYKKFAKKYHRQIKCFENEDERTFLISYAEKNAPQFKERGHFILSRETHFNMLVQYARFFTGHGIDDVVDDLLLLQVECRIFEKIVW